MHTCTLSRTPALARLGPAGRGRDSPAAAQSRASPRGDAPETKQGREGRWPRGAPIGRSLHLPGGLIPTRRHTEGKDGYFPCNVSFFVPPPSCELFTLLHSCVVGAVADRAGPESERGLLQSARGSRVRSVSEWGGEGGRARLRAPRRGAARAAACGPLGPARATAGRGEPGSPPPESARRPRGPPLPLTCRSGPERPGQSPRPPAGLPGAERRARAAPPERARGPSGAPPRPGGVVVARPRIPRSPAPGSRPRSRAPRTRRAAAAVAGARARGAGRRARPGRPLLSAAGTAGDALRRLLRAAARFELGVGPEPGERRW